jgi:tetratricopeptide (TPR) repeat protein
VTGQHNGPQDRRSKPFLILAGGALLSELVANIYANTFQFTSLGGWLQRHAAVVVLLGVGVAVVLALIFLVRRRREQGKADGTTDSARVPVDPPQPQQLPAWHRFPTRIHGRDRETGLALTALRFQSMVVIVGARDVGTSSVANLVVGHLLDDGVIGGPDAVVWVDLRGRSSTEPPGPRSVAGRLLSTFDLDEPADDTAPVLADAADRLLVAVRERATVLLLDNVFHADQVSWLTDRWPVTGALPMLVIAGDRPVASAKGTEHCVVDVDPLNLPAMRAILSDELGENWIRRLAGTVRGIRRDLRGDTDQMDELLRTFRGRPRAVREIARQLRMNGSRSASIGELVADSAGHGGNEPMVLVWQLILPSLMDHMSEHAKDLMRALAVLPVTGLSRAALDALLPAADRPVRYLDPVDELRQANVVEESPPGRFRLPEEVRLAVRRSAAGPVAAAVWTAVAGLVRYYATQATSWAAALGSVTDARSAIVWLHQEEPLLRALLTDWRPDAVPPVSLVADLAAIADALDVWYIREQQSDGLVRTSRGLVKLAAAAGNDELVRLAELRMAAAHRIGTHLDLADQAVGTAEPAGFALRARWHHERALIEFDRATEIGDDRPAAEERLQAAESELRIALELVPAADSVGRVCVLVNLAAVHLERRRLVAASELLDQAAVLAGAAGDLSGAAHVVESQGIAAIRGGNATQAVARWQQALALYRDLGEEQGEAHCLQHLGTLAVVSPDIAGLLDTGHRLPVGPNRAAAVARDYLARSKHLLAGQPDRTLVDYYLRIAEQRLAAGGHRSG